MLWTTHPDRTGIFKNGAKVRFVDNGERVTREDRAGTPKKTVGPFRLAYDCVDVMVPAQVRGDGETDNLDARALRKRKALVVETGGREAKTEEKRGMRARIVGVGEK